MLSTFSGRVPSRDTWQQIFHSHLQLWKKIHVNCWKPPCRFQSSMHVGVNITNHLSGRVRGMDLATWSLPPPPDDWYLLQTHPTQPHWDKSAVCPYVSASPSFRISSVGSLLNKVKEHWWVGFLMGNSLPVGLPVFWALAKNCLVLESYLTAMSSKWISVLFPSFPFPSHQTLIQDDCVGFSRQNTFRGGIPLPVSA